MINVFPGVATDEGGDRMNFKIPPFGTLTFNPCPDPDEMSVTIITRIVT